MTDAARVAFITGAGRGIGAATAISLARRGIATVLAVREPAAAAATARQVEAEGADCRVQACDVADADAVRRAVAETLQAWGRLDIVVNNAGVIEPIGHLGESDPAAWAQAMTVNLVGAYHVAQAALPALAASSCGAMLNVSTGAAHAPREGWSAYCCSKAALAMLTRCIALEAGPRGVSVYGLQPGLVDTEMQVRIRASGINEISRVPRGQLAAPSRAADLIAWLVDERPQDLRGQDLTINDLSLVTRAGLATN